MGPTQVVGGDDDALAELDGYYRRAGDDGRLRVLVGAIGLHVRSVIGAVDVVPGLRDPSVSLGEQVKVGESGLHEPCPKPAVGDPLSGMEAVCAVRRVCVFNPGLEGSSRWSGMSGCSGEAERRRCAMGWRAKAVEWIYGGRASFASVVLPCQGPCRWCWRCSAQLREALVSGCLRMTFQFPPY